MPAAKSIMVFGFLLVLTIGASGQDGVDKKPGDSTGLQHELIKESTLDELFNALKEIGPYDVRLFVSPKTFTAAWVQSPQQRPSPMAALSFSIGIILLTYGGYKLIFKTGPFSKFVGKIDTKPGKEKKERNAMVSKPRILQIATRIYTKSVSSDGNVVSTGTRREISPLPSFVFPEAKEKGMEEPQVIIFQVGFFNVVWAGIVPEDLSTKTALTIHVLLYVFICVLCLYPAASLLGAKITFGETFNYTVFLFSSGFLYLGLVIILGVLLYCDLFKQKLDLNKVNKQNFALAYTGGCLWIVATFGVVARVLFVGFQTLYAFTFWKFILCIFGAFALSAVICPGIFIPSLYIYLRCKKVIELLF